MWMNCAKISALIDGVHLYICSISCKLSSFPEAKISLILCYDSFSDLNSFVVALGFRSPFLVILSINNDKYDSFIT